VYLDCVQNYYRQASCAWRPSVLYCGALPWKVLIIIKGMLWSALHSLRQVHTVTAALKFVECNGDKHQTIELMLQFRKVPVNSPATLQNSFSNRCRCHAAGSVSSRSSTCCCSSPLSIRKHQPAWFYWNILWKILASDSLLNKDLFS